VKDNYNNDSNNTHQITSDPHQFTGSGTAFQLTSGQSPVYTTGAM